MALQETVLKAVARAKHAIQNLAIEASLVQKTPTEHVPGVSPTYVTVTTAVKVVLTAFDTMEIDGDRIRASDFKGLVFPEGSAIPEANDTLIINGRSHRVLFNEKVMAGDQIALSQLHLRLA